MATVESREYRLEATSREFKRDWSIPEKNMNCTHQSRLDQLSGMMRVTMHARHEPERTRAASEREMIPTMFSGFSL